MNRKIGWQKYEDVIQSEMHSPMANILFDDLASEVDEDEYEEKHETPEQEAFFLPKNFLVWCCFFHWTNCSNIFFLFFLA